MYVTRGNNTCLTLDRPNFWPGSLLIVTLFGHWGALGGELFLCWVVRSVVNATAGLHGRTLAQRIALVARAQLW
jgi:hypothetical protein